MTFSPPGRLTDMNTSFLVVGPVVRPGDVPALTDRLRTLRHDGTIGVVVCDVATITAPDAGTLDALARLQLAARRLGGRILLLDPDQRLRDLLTLTGFTEVLPVFEQDTRRTKVSRPE
ncbi:STAS domain-containing protein [Actinomycetes bacterium KLBMP 9797]